ncbi:MAG: class I SAM-dependent rRNA methyltransferase [Limnochordaceae bacterium]|nr:class I SAM-dependent rRNA methyltransferase [Limnochordaceae bacterium]
MNQPGGSAIPQGQARLTPGRHPRLWAGHLWIYAGEIAAVDGGPEPGDVVDVVDDRGHFIGRGLYNPRSQIAVRLLTHRDEPIDAHFFRERLQAALLRRRRFYQQEQALRLVYSEGDFLPGLIVDQYGPYLVVQFLTLGMQRRQSLIIHLLRELLTPAGILERDDVSSRRLEGLSVGNEVLWGRIPDRVQILENGLPFWVDLAGGQKTGFFLDQKENRQAIRALVDPGVRVLDAFCHTGAFALNALAAGAGEVWAVDISEEAIQLARDNERLWREQQPGQRGVVHWEVANAFDWLRAQAAAGEVFDVCILDPPAFTKGRESIPGAIRGYKEINLRAIKLCRPGGYLVTCSCSYHMNRDLFMEVVCQAAADAHRQLQLVEMRTQAKDHPILPAVPETEYLKCALLQVF